MLKTLQARTSLAALALAAILALGAAQAQAHAKLASATPAPDSSVASPKTIVLQFSEEIAKNLSNIKLTDAAGNAVATMQMPAPDAKSLSIMPNATLPSGKYTVSWTAVSTDDGHKMTGTYHFTVK